MKTIAAVKYSLVALVFGWTAYCLHLNEGHAQPRGASLTKIHPIAISPIAAPPNSNISVRLHFDAMPMAGDYNVFVHLRDSSNNIVFRERHFPPFPTRTSTWMGKQKYIHNVELLHSVPEGKYDVLVGIEGNSEEGRLPLDVGPGVQVAGDRTYLAGTLVVDAAAPPPPLDSANKAVALNLDGDELIFSEEFNGALDVSPWGPGTRWISHLPYGGNFGDSTFAQPRDGFPFHIQDGLLRIEAKKVGDKWNSGLLSSVDAQGRGFKKDFGYFEMRAKFPRGPGTWPAFWLLTSERLQRRTRQSFEIDIVEQYGHSPQRLHNVVHWWNADGTHRGDGNVFWVEDMSAEFHTYGCLIDENFIVFYFDRKEMWRIETPDEAKQDKYILVNLAMGPGWPLDKTPNPSHMFVDYIRVYAISDQRSKQLPE